MENNEGSSKDEKIGFHKGALSTLAKERQEVAKMLNIVEQLIQMHITELKDLGVDLEAQAKEISDKKDEVKPTTKPIDDLLE